MHHFVITFYLNDKGREIFDSELVRITAESREDIKTKLDLFEGEFRTFDIAQNKPELTQEIKSEWIEEMEQK